MDLHTWDKRANSDRVSGGARRKPGASVSEPMTRRREDNLTDAGQRHRATSLSPEPEYSFAPETTNRGRST